MALKCIETQMDANKTLKHINPLTSVARRPINPVYVMISKNMKTQVSDETEDRWLVKCGWTPDRSGMQSYMYRGNITRYVIIPYEIMLYCRHEWWYK